MMHPLKGRATEIADTLGKMALHVEQRHATAWDALFRNGAEVPVRVELDDDWVRLDAPDPVFAENRTGAADDLWSVLTRNGSLPPGVKLTFAVGDAVAPSVRLCGEILLDDAAELSVRLRDLCTAIKTVAHVWPAADDVWADSAPTAAIDVATLCHDTAWPVIERDGRVLVELDVADGFAQADVSARGNGAVAAAVAVADESPPLALRHALALLLLRVSGSVRLVRAAADATPRFEVVLAAPVGATALQHALAALSIAYRMAAREVAVLSTDEVIAEMYLCHCGPRAAIVTQP